MFKLVLGKAKEPEIKLPTSAGSWKKQESSRKSIYFCFIDYAKAFDCVDHNKLEILKEMGTPDHLTCLLRNLYTGQEATVRTGHGDRMDGFIDRKLDYLSRELRARQIRPSTVLTFGDCFLRDSLQNAHCFSAGAKYHFEIQSFQMFGTVADCFIAVDQLVLREKRLTLKKLIDATEANFDGYPDVLALCRNADKYGMDTPLSNAHVKKLSKTALPRSDRRVSQCCRIQQAHAQRHE